VLSSIPSGPAKLRIELCDTLKDHGSLQSLTFGTGPQTKIDVRSAFSFDSHQPVTDASLFYNSLQTILNSSPLPARVILRRLTTFMSVSASLFILTGPLADARSFRLKSTARHAGFEEAKALQSLRLSRYLVVTGARADVF
jgi:hypothetical protein